MMHSVNPDDETVLDDDMPEPWLDEEFPLEAAEALEVAELEAATALNCTATPF